MGNVKNLEEDFHKIFNSAQLSTGGHQKSALKLRNLYNLADSNAFFQQFKRCTDFFLLVDVKIKNPYVERVMEFIGLFCYTLKQAFDEENENKTPNTEDIIEHPFLDQLFSYILERQNVINFTVRIRSCQLINKVLNQLVGTDLSTEFCDRIEESMLERLNDPKLEVRLEGIQALHRFQEKHNPLDRIIDEFKLLMEHDRFAKVRRICVEKIALREDVVPIMLLKIRDMDVGVRLAAFTRFSKIPGSLKIEQRRLIIKSASLDTSDKIRNFVESTLLPKWLNFFNENPHNFMKAIRFDANEVDVKETNELCEFILKATFKTKPLAELLNLVDVAESYKLIPYEKLNWETSNYWRILVQYIRTYDHFEEAIERIIPELVHFCKYIKGFCDNLPDVKSTTDFLENQFILRQLFTISKGYDISDPIGRAALKKLVGIVLKDVILTLDTAQVIVSNLEILIPDVEHRARYINELISEISSPDNATEAIKRELEIAERIKSLKEEVITTSRDQEIAIAEKKYLLADSLEERLKDLTTTIIEYERERTVQVNLVPTKKKDIATLVKILDIATGLLLSPQIRKITASLETLKIEIIFDLMIHDNESIQSKALHCYGLFCIIDKKTASDGIHLFSAPISAYQSGQECDIQILNVCIGSIVDLLRIYGTQLIAAPEERTDLSESQREDHQRHFFGGTSLTRIIQGLVDLMDDEQVQVQETAGHGLCSLILSNTVQSSSLLSRMVLKWCNPYDGSQKLKQMIGVTLQKLPYVCGFHRQWENAILATLKVIIYASDNSPYLEINVDEIAKFMIALYQVNLMDNEEVLNFALKICSEIAKKPKAKQVLTLSKLLNTLNFSDDSPIVEDLVAICEELRDVTRNRLVDSNIIKFVSKLNVRRRTDQPNEAEDNSDNSIDDNEELEQTNQLSTVIEAMDTNEESVI